MRQNNSAVIINDRGKKEDSIFVPSMRSHRGEETDFQGCGRMEVGGGGLFLNVRLSWVDGEVDRKGRRGFDRKTEGRIFGGRKLMASSRRLPAGTGQRPPTKSNG